MENIQLPDSLEEVLQRSVQLEEEGYEYYRKSAEKISNSVGKRMLERLANDEKNHIARFKEMYKAVTENKIDQVKLINVDSVTFDQLFDRLKDQLEGAIEDLGQHGVDDSEIIAMAQDLESHTRLFYQKAAERSDDEKIKTFYQMLAKEEKAHYDVLQKAQQFLEDPSLYFSMRGYH